MKNKQLLYSLTLGILSIIWSCSKDLGNYSYTDHVSTDDYVISGIDEVVYADFSNDFRIKVEPVIKDKDGKTLSNDLFTYQWGQNGTPGNPFPAGYTWGNNRILDTIYDKTETIVMYFRAIEKASGIFIEKQFVVQSVDVFNSGYFLLTEKNDGSSRIQIATTNYPPGDTIVTDMNDVLKVPVPLDGRPVYLNRTYPLVSTVEDGYMFISLPLLITSTNATYADRHYIFTPDLNLSYNGITPYGAFADYSDFRYYDHWIYGIFYTNGQLYPMNMGGGWGACYVQRPVNTYNGSSFTASPFVAVTKEREYAQQMDALAAVVYDTDAHQFLRISNISSSTSCQAFPANTSTLFPYQDPTMSLVYLGSTTYDNNTACAVLKNDVTGDYYYARFDYVGTQKEFKKIENNSVQNATLFELDPTYGYLIYATSDNKLYQYNTNTGSTLEQADFGDKKVSIIKNQTFRNTSSNAFYASLSRCMYVGVYNESDKENSGELYVYDVRPSGQSFTTFAHYTGLGKIVSMYHTN